ncbi:MAG: hypothetical protein ACLU9S_24080 [Oscillospiraceae bacterium]
MRKMPPERLAGVLATSLDVADEAGLELSGDEFSARVLALSIPAESKVAILDLYHRPEPVLEQASLTLTRAIRLPAAEKKPWKQSAPGSPAPCSWEGVERFLTHTSSLNCAGAQHSVHPFLLAWIPIYL